MTVPVPSTISRTDPDRSASALALRLSQLKSIAPTATASIEPSAARCGKDANIDGAASRWLWV